MENPVVKALWEIVESLESKQINYAVMGGLAVRALAIPRPTNDVDLTIQCTEVELPNLLRSWESEAIQVPEIYLNGWLDRVGGMPLVKLKTRINSDYTVDLDIFLCETPFQQSLLARRIKAEIGDGRSLWVVSPEDLVLLKLIANRPRDLVDVTDLLFIQGQLDESYMQLWAARLGITDRLNTVLEKP